MALLAALAVPHFALGEDKRLDFDELPAAVAKAIKDAAGDAKIGKVVLEEEDGTPAYEAAWTTNGRKHEITVDKTGKVLSLEEIIPLAEAPEVVRAAIQKEAGDGKVAEVEKVQANGKTVFEVTIKKGKNEATITFDEAGKVLEREGEEKDGKDEDDEKGEKKEKKGRKD
jgi:uncharacterized membrane protein YkoI